MTAGAFQVSEWFMGLQLLVLIASVALVPLATREPRK